jgi:hypothetical protein
MSVNRITSPDLAFSRQPGVKAGQASAATGGDFLATLKERLVDFKAQTLGTLMSAVASGGAGGGLGHSNALDALLGNAGSQAGLSATGRNNALFDPESGYRMMSEINRRDVSYRAEFAEMTDLGAYVTTMHQAAGQLGTVDGASTSTDIRSRLNDFVATYNGWIDRFDEVLANGGLLAGTHAATVSQWELEQSVESIFNGAGNGVRGMGGLGLTIDPVTNMASLDTAKLDAVLAGNPGGAVSAIREFSGNFAKSAELLNSAGNFIPNRMDNLSRVIDYLNANKSALQAEFGLGDATKPTGDVARALAAYNAMGGTTA